MATQDADKKRLVTGDKAGQEIRRLWGEVEVVDSKHDLRVIISPEDVAQATQKDPACCVFAQACNRLFGSTKVLFFRSIAYVELVNEDGTRRVERFEMPRSMRDLIEAFDRGETVIPKAGFLLKAVRPNRRFDSMLRSKKRSRELAKKAALEGTLQVPNGNQGKGSYRDKPMAVDLRVRNGTGAVHFTIDKDAK